MHKHSFFISSFRRFLLARHKAAIDVYNEAAKMNEKDWVRFPKDLKNLKHVKALLPLRVHFTVFRTYLHVIYDFRKLHTIRVYVTCI